MQAVTARIEIPTRTIFKVLLVLATLWFLARIGPVLQQLFAGLVLALALYPPVARLQARGYRKGPAIATVFGTLVAILTLALLFLVPRMIDEGQAFVDDLPTYVTDGAGWLKDNVPWLYDRLLEWAEGASGEELPIDEGETESSSSGDVSTGSADLAEAAPTGDGGPVGTEAAISVGQAVADFVATAFVAIVLAIYFLVDGDRAFRWLSRDLNPRTVRRIRRAAPITGAIVNSYVLHQIQTSVLCGIYTFAVLAILDVPSALILATIAAITDAIPLIGVVMGTLPAVVVALTQGWETALAVLIAYVAYQAIENWVLIPRLFGRSLRLSSFGMLMAVLIGWKLAGLIGAFLALPTAAVLLAVERIWMDEDPGIQVPEAMRTGPADIAEAAVDVAADLAGEDGPEAAEPDEAAGQAAEPDEVKAPVTQAATSDAADATPPASGRDPAAGGRGRRGGRRGRAGRAAPGTTSG